MKKKISSEIIADSVNENGERITSFVLTFPRFILAELNTHRALSRNSASSRAIPFGTMSNEVTNDPFIPIDWQRNHKGMQGTEYIVDDEEIKEIIEEWIWTANSTVSQATILNSSYDVTKQLCNRMLEPYLWHKAIVTATDLENFFALRCPEYVLKIGNEKKSFRSKVDMLDYISGFDQLKFEYENVGQGEIHIMELAERMWDSMKDSEPSFLKEGEWHIPFGDKLDENRLHEVCRASGYVFDKEIAKVKIATARCARVSYLNFNGKDDYNADIKLHGILSKSGHWSPFEHCARAMTKEERDNNLVIQDGVVTSGVSGNFRGFIQYRKMFKGENIV